MDFECPCPRSRLPSQLVHLINRAHCGLRCLSHQRQRCQQLWENIATDRSRLEGEKAQVV